MTVLNRLCFFEKVGGTVRPFEWAVINESSLGPMVEPFWPFDTNSGGPCPDGSGRINDDFSTNNDFQRVDNFVEADDITVLKALNCGNITPWMHGGRNYPRSGR